MVFKAFLQLSCQLVDSSVAKVFVDEREIEFHTSDKMWLLSAKIHTQSSIPTPLMGLLTQTSLTQRGVKGAQFRYNKQDNSISLMLKSSPLSHFVQFKNALEGFIKLLEEWEGIVKAFQPNKEMKIL